MSLDALTHVWKEMVSTCLDDADRFIFLLSRKQSAQGREGVRHSSSPKISWVHRPHVEPGDFEVILRYVLDHHPGLLFLKDFPEFYPRYMETVIARIFFVVNRLRSSFSSFNTSSESIAEVLVSILFPSLPLVAFFKES